VLADLKEREPQYKALTKRVQLRASGGRAAQRAAAKAEAAAKVASRRGVAPGRAGEPAVSVPDDAEPEVADEAAADGADETHETVADGTTVNGEPVVAAASQPASRPAARSGPRQQPRRTSAAKRRPSGKKRRR
jgi:hypothetical protein